MNAWIEDWLNAQATNSGFLVRKNVDEVHEHSSRQEITAEVRRRRWHLLQVADQYIVICNAEPVTMYC